MAQTVKSLPAMQEAWVRSLSQEDLEKRMATLSSLLGWRIPWTEEPDELQSLGSQRVEHDSDSHFHFTCYKPGSVLRAVKAGYHFLRIDFLSFYLFLFQDFTWDTTLHLQIFFFFLAASGLSRGIWNLVL